jgi:hypothetical protein
VYLPKWTNNEEERGEGIMPGYEYPGQKTSKPRVGEMGFPLRQPVAPCMGWLSHNTQTCNCYADDRRMKQDRLENRGFFASLFGRD